MSYLDILQTIRRLHAANGQLEEVRGHLGNIERTLSYNPRNSETWDIFNLRDDRLVRITRACGRAASHFHRLSRGRTTVRSHSMDLSRLFANWASAYAAHGEDSRQVNNAKMALLLEIMNARGEITGIARDADEALIDLRKYKKFYAHQEQIFGRVAGLASGFIRYWPDSSQKPQAFAIMQSSEDIENASRRCFRSITGAISNLRTLKRAVNVERRALDTWQRWSTNDRNVQRDVARNRAPI